jgi:hypothetical protein
MGWVMFKRAQPQANVARRSVHELSPRAERFFRGCCREGGTFGKPAKASSAALSAAVVFRNSVVGPSPYARDSSPGMPLDPPTVPRTNVLSAKARPRHRLICRTSCVQEDAPVRAACENRVVAEVRTFQPGPLPELP